MLCSRVFSIFSVFVFSCLFDMANTQYNIIQSNTMQYSIIQYNSMHSNIIQCYAGRGLWCTGRHHRHWGHLHDQEKVRQYNAVQYTTIIYIYICFVIHEQYNLIQYNTIQHRHCCLYDQDKLKFYNIFVIAISTIRNNMCYWNNNGPRRQQFQ